MKKKIFILVLLFLGLLVKAQVIKGKIVDYNSEAVVYANIVQFTNDSVFILGCTTDLQGLFNMPKADSASLLKISFIGYKDKWFDLQKSHTDLGTIIMEQDVVVLNEVTVSAGLPKVYIKGDAQVTDVANSVLADVGSGDDVLAKIPGMVKSNNGLEVFGKGAPLIFVDNREVRDMSEVEQLSSTEIARVELVTNPGARYDATVGSVVRIYTKKGLEDGLGLDFRSSVYQSENTDFRGILKLNYKRKRLEVFGSFDYKNYTTAVNQNIRQRNIVDCIWDQNQTMDEVVKEQYAEGVLEANYNINDKHSIGVKYNITARPMFRDSIFVSSVVFQNNEFYDSLFSPQLLDYDYKASHRVNAYYVGKIKNTSVDLNIDYLNSNYSVYDKGIENSLMWDDRVFDSKNLVKNDLIAGKLTFVSPLFGGNLSYGGQLSFTNRQDDFFSLSQYADTSFCLIKDKNIAAFLEYDFTVPIGKFSVGCRYEHVGYDYYVQDIHIENQSKIYDRVFPHVSFMTQIKSVQLMLSYSVKTNRPSYRDLRNSVEYINRFTLQSGNPFLASSFTHGLSLLASWKFVQLSVDYDNHKDCIFEWAIPSQDAPDITIIKPENFDKFQQLNISVMASPQIGIWDPSLMIGLQMQNPSAVSQEEYINFNKPMFLGKFDNSFSLSNNWFINFDVLCQSKGHAGIYYISKGIVVCDLYLRKALLNDALNIILGVSDIFKQRGTWVETYWPNLRLYNHNVSDSREVYLTLRYKLRPKSSKYKGTMAGENEMQRL